ncbi:DNA helicase [Streptomyces phage Wentworth]|nr:DNA helicase [Streptomyces phage Wentworth]
MTEGVYETAVDLMKAAGITPRPRQLDLLQFLSDGGARYVQAPTGVGKSFAAIAHAAANAELTGDVSIIIAADNTLLDQYAMKDLPRMAESGRFTYAVVKGRRHYACASANNEDNEEYQAMMDRAMSVDRMRGPEQAKPVGEINPCNGGGRCVSCAGVGVCEREDCEHDGGICWAKRARKLSHEADIVLTNTSMWLVNANLYDQTDGLVQLIPFGQPYVDEAQQLPQTVRDSLGWELTPNSGGALGRDLAEELRHAVKGIIEQYVASEVAEGRSADAKSPAQRLKDRALTDTERASLVAILRSLREAMKETTLKDEDIEDDLETPSQFLERRIFALEKKEREEWDDGVALTWIDVNGIHWDVLHAGPSVVNACRHWQPKMISATVPASLPRRTGFAKAKPDFIPQMFDWKNDCEGIVVDAAMDPGDWKNKGWFEQRWDVLAEHIDSTQGGVLILATSNMDADRLYNLAAKRYQGRRLVLCQEPGNTSANPGLVKAFKEDGNAILVGVESFWKGVDVPGDALKLVAIWKLPYSVPTLLHNAIGGKTRDMQFSYSNECMHTRLAQGIGRLLRSEQDTGKVVVCDGRFRRVLLRGPIPQMSKHLPLAFKNG